MNTTNIFRVFVGSPDDVIEEKNILSKVIDEINVTLGEIKNYRLELISWQTHTYPAIGIDAQDVINSQISGNFDIFIGILSSKLGTPTKRADSGTIEEFEIAYDKYVENPNRMIIMFYFKNPLVHLWDVDPEQLYLIKEFRNKLIQKGAYYWTYKTVDEFKDFIRVHLIKSINNYQDNKIKEPIIVEPNTIGHLNIITINSWIASTNITTPQWADYKKLDLKNKKIISFSCEIKSESNYYRFGVKLLKKNGKVFGDGSLQSQDNNFIFHIGKNHESDEIFITTYTNGIRNRPDKKLHTNGNEMVKIGMTYDEEGFLHFLINDMEQHVSRISREILYNFYLLAWGDGNEYKVTVNNIKFYLDET